MTELELIADAFEALPRLPRPPVRCDPLQVLHLYRDARLRGLDRDYAISEAAANARPVPSLATEADYYRSLLPRRWCWMAIGAVRASHERLYDDVCHWLKRVTKDDRGDWPGRRANPAHRARLIALDAFLDVAGDSRHWWPDATVRERLAMGTAMEAAIAKQREQREPEERLERAQDRLERAQDRLERALAAAFDNAERALERVQDRLEAKCKWLVEEYMLEWQRERERWKRLERVQERAQRAQERLERLQNRSGEWLAEEYMLERQRWKWLERAQERAKKRALRAQERLERLQNLSGEWLVEEKREQDRTEREQEWPTSTSARTALTWLEQDRREREQEWARVEQEWARVEQDWVRVEHEWSERDEDGFVEADWEPCYYL